MTDNGLIIYFDGPDGVGKTKQLELAADALRGMGHKAYLTHVLGGTPISLLLRDAMMSEHPRSVETDLHIALACQHSLLEDLIKRREAGEVVLVDRSPLSIIGYQMYGEGLDRVSAYEAVGELLDLFQPDLMLTFKASPELLEKRRHHRNATKGVDYFESKPADFHQKTAEGFTYAAKHFGAKVVDADGSIEEVHEAAMKFIKPLL